MERGGRESPPQWVHSGPSFAGDRPTARVRKDMANRAPPWSAGGAGEGVFQKHRAGGSFL